MAAYAALVSLTHTLNHILNPPPTHQLNNVREQIEFLQEKVSFLIDFLENYSIRVHSKEIEDLETEIADAAYAAEDIIESNVIDQILERNGINREKSSGTPLCEGVQTVIERFHSIEKAFVKIEDRKGVEDPRSKNVTIATNSSPSGKNMMVGFEKHLIEIMSALTTDESDLRIIPIVGMGGIGKTTLATNVYNNPFIVEHFYIRAWVTISQECAMRELLLGLLHQIKNRTPSEQEMTDDQLGELLYKELFERKYLIVMDDMWNIEDWDRVIRFLPSNSNGSRILATTRLLNLAVDFGSCSPYEMDFLDEEQSWNLLREKVFAQEGCPVELEETGKNIAKRCRGLPLALVVIGGLLAKSHRTKEHWESVEEDVTSAVKDENDEHYMKILSLSYNHLPMYLKPCFLYLAVFPEDFEIKVSRLVRLWVAEGLIKQQTTAKSLEEIAEEYLEDLIDRNLILVRKRGSSGKVKCCNIHDFIRELCGREAQKDKFVRIVKLDDPKISPYIERQRRLIFHAGVSEEKVFEALRSAPQLNRSFLSYSYLEPSKCFTREFCFVRVLDVVHGYSIDEILQLINLRYVACTVYGHSKSISSSISLLWNLQTLVVDEDLTLPSEIWQMPQLRHVKMARFTLPDPPDSQMDGQDIIILRNLQTLSTVNTLRCTDQVVERIPNLNKLGIYCYTTEEIGSFRLSNLVRLHKLESLVLAFTGKWGGNIAFPSSLKKLTLRYCQIPWEDMSIVGSLPNLEVLRLRTFAAIGREWNPIEGEFCRLKFLMINGCELDIWGADNTHFPSLERLIIRDVSLEIIPKGFAEIPTLQAIDLLNCSTSLLESAKEISEERESLGYEDLQVRSFSSKISSLRQDSVVGFEDDADTLIKYLNEESEELEVISIIGMPGLGKTTLAWKIYSDPRIQYEFPTLIWVYVDQDFYRRDAFLTILKKFTPQDMSDKTEPELAQIVRSYLEKSRFLLFMDNVPTAEAWKDIEAFLPKSNRLGKVLITSRHEKVAWLANLKRKPHRLRFLDYKDSWELLQLKVFGKLECPPELEVLGKLIAEQCGGVPLALAVIGGILVGKFSTIKVNLMKNEWEDVLASLSAYYPDDDKEKCTENIIALSYNKLPYDLKCCLVYFNLFPQDVGIPAWKLTRLWIADGFVQEKPDRSLEEVADENLNELISRNLVMVDKSTTESHRQEYFVHDMIREFSINMCREPNC